MTIVESVKNLSVVDFVFESVLQNMKQNELTTFSKLFQTWSLSDKFSCGCNKMCLYTVLDNLLWMCLLSCSKGSKSGLCKYTLTPKMILTLLFSLSFKVLKDLFFSFLLLIIQL